MGVAIDIIIAAATIVSVTALVFAQSEARPISANLVTNMSSSVAGQRVRNNDCGQHDRSPLQLGVGKARASFDEIRYSAACAPLPKGEVGSRAWARSG